MQSGPRPSSTEAATSNDPSNWQARSSRWLLSYGLYVEILLALLTLVVAFAAIVAVLVGSITALPTGPPPEGGEPNGGSGILEFGTLLVNGGLLLAIGLGLLLLVHGAVELWTSIQNGLNPTFDDGIALAYVLVRTVQTVAAAVFVGPILVGVGLSHFGVIGDPSNTLLLILFVAGIVLLASVFAHAVGRAVRSLVEA